MNSLTRINKKYEPKDMPDSYYKCLLENLPKAQTSNAANMMKVSCQKLYGYVAVWEPKLTVQEIQMALFGTVHSAAIGEAVYEFREEGFPEKTAVENLTKEFEDDPAAAGVTAIIKKYLS